MWTVKREMPLYKAADFGSAGLMKLIDGARPAGLQFISGCEPVIAKGNLVRMRDVACIDLFCGAGGLTHGLQREGINVVAGVDVEETCRHPFEFNNSAEFINEDVSRVSGLQTH